MAVDNHRPQSSGRSGAIWHGSIPCHTQHGLTQHDTTSLQTIVDNAAQLAVHGVLDYCCRRRQSLCRLAHDDHVGGSLVVQTPGTADASPCDRNTDLHVANWACCRPSRPRALADDPSAIAQPLVSTNRAIQALPMPIDTIVAGASPSSSSSLQSPYSSRHLVLQCLMQPTCTHLQDHPIAVPQ